MKSNFKNKIRKGVITALALGILNTSYAINPSEVYAGLKDSIKKHPWRWAAGITAVVGGAYVYNENQKKAEEDRKKAEEEAKYTADSDTDGMLDSLEMQYFGNLNQPADGDYDNDGYTNSQEINNGSDPSNPGSMPGDDWHDLRASSIQMARSAHVVSGSKKICSVKPSSLESTLSVNPINREVGFAVPVKDFMVYGTKSLTNSDFKINLAYKFK